MMISVENNDYDPLLYTMIYNQSINQSINQCTGTAACGYAAFCCILLSFGTAHHIL